MREHEWKWSHRNRSYANIWSKFRVQLLWTTSSPPVKGDYHVWSDTCSIRHGAVVCRIVNWKGLNAYSVTSPLNIWTKFGVWLPRTLDGPPWKGKENVSYLLFILLSGPRRGRGVVRIVIWNFWIMKWENMNESGPAGIEVMRIFGPNSVCSCLGPQVVHLWKGTTIFGLILAEYDMAQWFVE